MNSIIILNAIHSIGGGGGATGEPVKKLFEILIAGQFASFEWTFWTRSLWTLVIRVEITFSGGAAAQHSATTTTTERPPLPNVCLTYCLPTYGSKSTPTVAAAAVDINVHRRIIKQ